MPRPTPLVEHLLRRAGFGASAIKAHCREHLAAYKIPKIVEFAATLPRTSSGKVQRHKLAEEIK